MMQNCEIPFSPESDAGTTRERLIEAGIEEFFEKGYRQASLRRICAACGVTTGAFYFHFSGKQQLFSSIVEPVIEQWTSLGNILAERELKDQSTALDNDRVMMDLELRHRREILILLEKSSGSGKEHFLDNLKQELTKHFMTHFTKAIGHVPNPEFIQLLANMRIYGNIQLLKGNYDRSQTLFFNDMLACYAEGGFTHLIQNCKEQL
ncbi:TetR/AcrR family transcriptional regulator [Lacrimispora defluvii]|uniref:TetR/AcrR family transcriptional regulator n=1 Tax=Lacrimispora defluvii TaxID=2719233 RepID=A0ABX1VQI7_9FIRM|nr:TetR/AcrR family transcriptional regulator [Lacrimispora defluvii]NNJ30702.1 TetR/AcrR family transcriptional regulator [Lacrimispora defluvii]